MSMHKMREEFEAWASLKFDCPVSVFVKARTQESEDEGFPYRIKNDHGDESDEVNALVGTAWVSWQASRAAMVVELPKQPDVDTFTRTQSAYWQGIHTATIAIESAGVKVK